MGFFPVQSGGFNTSLGLGIPSTVVPTVLTSGGANTKGTWTDLGSTTPRRAQGFWVDLTDPTVNVHEYIVDIGWNVSGTRTVIVPNLNFYNGGQTNIWRSYYCPIPVPAGTQFSARMQSDHATAVCSTGVSMSYGGLHRQTFQGCDSMGITLASSLPLALGHPAANNAKANNAGNFSGTAGVNGWNVVSSSTLRRYRALTIATSSHLQAQAGQYRLYDIAIGGAGSEKIIIPNWQITQNTVSDDAQPGVAYIPLAVDIPKATRIAVQYQQDVTGAGRDNWLSFYGWY